eukprot:9301670-Pyramimonas_sp.AAC.1
MASIIGASEPARSPTSVIGDLTEPPRGHPKSPTSVTCRDPERTSRDHRLGPPAALARSMACARTIYGDMP